jgi:lysozyme family protein
VTRDEAAGVLVGRVLVREGGIADVGDGKGVTRFGQTPGWLDQFGFTPPRTPAEAEANYRTWLVRTRLIGVCDVPDAFADGVIDWAVHAGHPVSIRGLQRALGVMVDGVLGPETQAAIDACDRALIGRKVLASRVRSIGRLITDAPQKHARFAAGWLNRLADQIEALT